MSAFAKAALAGTEDEYRQILGLRFFTGQPDKAVERMKLGGLLVVPAGPALKDLPYNHGYREALLNADLTITDSGFMVLLWNFLMRDNIPKVSGLAYMRELLKQEHRCELGKTFWILANPTSAACNIAWLKSQGIVVEPRDMYIAPMYGGKIFDPALLDQIRARRPRHIIVTLGGGTQEQLGHYLKQNLDFHPGIHCIGAAIAFLSGDQVRIPDWADKLFLGWLFRCLSEPQRYIARYWGARKLLPLMLRYRENLPSDPDAASCK